MELKQVPLAGKGFRGKLLLDYLQQDPFLSPYYAFEPTLPAFQSAIASREKYPVNREVLKNVLLLQHEEFLGLYPKLKDNIEAIQDSKTFTVTTGHQLCLAGGPLFFIYKIITAINLAEELSVSHPDKTFVPVYWMATEDHDFAEIASVELGEKTFTWNHVSGMPTGRMDTDGLEVLIDEIEKRFSASAGFEKLIAAVRKAYAEGRSLSDATRTFVLEFFGQYGLVVLDADDKHLKRLFADIIADELLHQRADQLMKDSDAELSSRYHLQIHPREINLFYITDQQRSRIVREGEMFRVMDSEMLFTEEALLEELKQFPERFSPNVVLRPVYQELILPNLAYVGGPAETAYWLQLKPVFDHFKIFYPVLVPRNHGLIINEKAWKNWQKMGLGYDEIFEDSFSIEKKVLNGISSFDKEIEDSSTQVSAIYQHLADVIRDTDPTLSPMVLARHAAIQKDLKKIAEKQMRAMRRKHATERNYLQSMFTQVKPDATPQERIWSFVMVYALLGDNFPAALKDGMLPFSDSLTVIHTL